MKEKSIDLHIHSTMSDGTLSPREIVREAAELGLCAVALTDHDSVAGVREAQNAAAGTDLEVITGVELSVYDDREMHILGYGIHPEHAALQQFLRYCRETRAERVRAIVRRLAEDGFEISAAEVFERAAHMAGRVHIAQCLMEKGYIRSVGEAFERFFGEGKSYYVPRRQIRPQEAIAAIHEAGGLAVLAHPYFLHRDDTLAELLAELTELDGLECHYPRHTREQRTLYQELAQRFGLLQTGGSDFHGANRPEAKLGQGCCAEPIPYACLERMREYKKLRK